MAGSNRVHQLRRIGRRRSGERMIQSHADRYDFERGFVSRNWKREDRFSWIGVSQRELRMRTGSAEEMDVFDDVARPAAERIWSGLHVDRDVMTACRADFDAVEAQHAGPVRRRIGLASGVAVIGEDDELPSGFRGGGGDLVGSA